MGMSTTRVRLTNRLGDAAAHCGENTCTANNSVGSNRTELIIPRIVPFDLSDEAITSGQPVTIHCNM